MHSNGRECSILATLYNLLTSRTKGPTQAWGAAWMHVKLPKDHQETILLSNSCCSSLCRRTGQPTAGTCCGTACVQQGVGTPLAATATFITACRVKCPDKCIIHAPQWQSLWGCPLIVTGCSPHTATTAVGVNVVLTCTHVVALRHGWLS